MARASIRSSNETIKCMLDQSTVPYSRRNMSWIEAQFAQFNGFKTENRKSIRSSRNMTMAHIPAITFVLISRRMPQSRMPHAATCRMPQSRHSSFRLFIICGSFVSAIIRFEWSGLAAPFLTNYIQTTVKRLHACVYIQLPVGLSLHSRACRMESAMLITAFQLVFFETQQ